jgi:hypothetical protein
LAQKYLDSAQKKADEDKKALGVVVKNYRLNPENVFGPGIVETPPLPAALPTTIVPITPSTANRNVTVNY